MISTFNPRTSYKASRSLVAFLAVTAIGLTPLSAEPKHSPIQTALALQKGAPVIARELPDGTEPLRLQRSLAEAIKEQGRSKLKSPPRRASEAKDAVYSRTTSNALQCQDYVPSYSNYGDIEDCF